MMRSILSAAALLLAAAPASAQKPPAVPDSTGAYELRAVTQPPRVLNARELAAALEATYPPVLRASGTAGQVEVRMRVDTLGVPTEVVVTRSTDSRFDPPTVEAVKKLRFAPAELDGRPVIVWVLLPIHWTVSAK
jgi:TonB family protein